MEAPIVEIPDVDDIPVPKKSEEKPAVKVEKVTPPAPAFKSTPSVTAQYGVKPATTVKAEEKDDFVAPDVKEGSIVQHKTFGEGTVTKLDDKHIRVSFAAGEKNFIFPDAFKMGFLKM